MSVSIQTILFPPKKKPSAAPSKQRSIRVSSKIKCAPPKPPPIVDPLDQKRLESILNSISIQGDELLLGEEMWRKRAQEKRLTDNCLTSVGRSKSVATTFPTIQQAKEWSFEVPTFKNIDMLRLKNTHKIFETTHRKNFG